MTQTNTATVRLSLTAEQLPDDTAALKTMVLELMETARQCERENATLRHQIDKLIKRIYGPRNERFDPNQRLLFALEPESPEPVTPPPPEPADQNKPKRKCRPHGRRRLPENLPRQSQHHVLTQAERICPQCGEQCQEIGTDKSEHLNYKPASLMVVEHFVHKYACPCCGKIAQQPPAGSETMAQQQPAPAQPNQAQAPAPECQQAQATQAATSTPQPATASQGEHAARVVVIAAAKPAMPIRKGLPGAGLLAHLIVSKYVDHLPLYRLERVYERQGVFLPRSTLCDWLMACSEVLRPLYDLLVSMMLRSRALHTDDTSVKMQDPSTHTLSTARMWVYLGDAANPYNLFDFTVNRKRDGPCEFLAGYQGYLHADAFSGYDCLYLPSPLMGAAPIIEVACNAHARRKFYDARLSDILRSHTALAYYRQLYDLEKSARDFSEEGRRQMRQEVSLPTLNKLHAWMEKERPEVLPKSPMGEALAYAMNNWDALKRYTEAGFLAIDNNAAEREMKRVAIGRKNWLFVGSRRGGEAAAVLMSFTSTCNRLGVEPWTYLDDVLTRLPMTPKERLVDLVPDRWQAARQDKQLTQPPAEADGASTGALT